MNRRHCTIAEPAVPPVLPHVIITVTDTGSLQVTVDDEPLTAPEGVDWTRSDFARVLDMVTHERTVPVRIEVRETDGTVFTDLIHARRQRPAPTKHDQIEHNQAEETNPGSSRRGRRSRSRGVELVEVTGQGFVPGEDVAVAVILIHTDATATGDARALLDQSTIRPLVGDSVGEVVLFGRVSGTLCVRGLR
ncbi:hypothetical protein [Kocuria carniphila]|uniref:hypothetical protein n=1 Tax=Kocuria carniphila TaxID=262208 RepID=UPI0028E7CDBE|nr:hypothetical protein [Kocuria carniphila]